MPKTYRSSFEISKSVNDAKHDLAMRNPVGVYTLDGKHYTIIRNFVTGGYMCTFCHNGEWFTADFSYIKELGTYEVMIFHSDSEGKIEDWINLSVERFDTHDIDNLKNHIDKFVANDESIITDTDIDVSKEAAEDIDNIASSESRTVTVLGHSIPI